MPPFLSTVVHASISSPCTHSVSASLFSPIPCCQFRGLYHWAKICRRLKRTWHHLCHFEWFWWSIDNAINGINMIIKMIILRLLDSSDDKEKIDKVRSKGQELKRPWRKPSQRNQDRDTLVSPVKPTLRKSHTSVHWLGAHQEFWFHRLNRR